MKEQGKGIFDLSWFEKLIPSRIRTEATTEKRKNFQKVYGINVHPVMLFYTKLI